VCGDLTSRRLSWQEEHPGKLWRKRVSNLLSLVFILLLFLFLIFLPRATEQGGVSQLQPAFLALCFYGRSLRLPDKYFPDPASIR